MDGTLAVLRDEAPTQHAPGRAVGGQRHRYSAALEVVAGSRFRIDRLSERIEPGLASFLVIEDAGAGGLAIEGLDRGRPRDTAALGWLTCYSSADRPPVSVGRQRQRYIGWVAGNDVVGSSIACRSPYSEVSTGS